MFDIAVDDGPVSGAVDRGCGERDAWPAEVWGEPPAVPSLGELPASGFAALELDLATGDPAGMSDGELVDAVVGWDRVVSWGQARQARLLAEFGRRRGDTREAFDDPRPSVGSRFAPDEVGVALRISRGAAMARLNQARGLDEQLPAVLAAWEAGRLDAGKVRAIGEATAFLPVEDAVAVAARVLGRAPELSVAELRAALARAVLAVDPQGGAERHRAARRERRVTVSAAPEGMATLWALLSAPDARSAWEWLTRLARGLGAEDPRGMDARRADLLVALLTGRLTALDTSTDTDGSTDCTDSADSTGTADSAATDSADTDSADTADTADTDSADTGSTGTGSAGSTDTGSADTGSTDTDSTDTDSTDTGSAGSTDTDGSPDTDGSTDSTGTADSAATDATDTDTDPGPTDTDTAGSDTAGSTAGSVADGPADEPWRPARERVRPVTPGKPLVQVVVPYSTLLGADDRPCELTGYGPIPADLAREIAADAVWTRLVTDPLSGALLDHGRTTYHPPAALADFVRARDLHCRGPRCRRPATGRELDHFVPYPHGPTSEPNLWAACKHDHDLKHHAGWQVLLHDDRTLEWITPTGHRYTSHPHDHRPGPDEPGCGLPAPGPEPPQPTAVPAAPLADPPPF